MPTEPTYLYDFEIRTFAEHGFTKLEATTFEGRPELQQRIEAYKHALGVSDVTFFLADYQFDGKPVANSTTNGRAAGSERFIVISRKMEKMLNDKELSLVIGHELSHAKHLVSDKATIAASNVPTGAYAAAGGVAGAGISSAILGIAALVSYIKQPRKRGRIHSPQPTAGAEEPPPAGAAREAHTPHRRTRRNLLKVAAASAVMAVGGAAVKQAGYSSREAVGERIESRCDTDAEKLLNDPDTAVSTWEKLAKHYEECGFKLNTEHGHRSFEERAGRVR